MILQHHPFTMIEMDSDKTMTFKGLKEYDVKEVAIELKYDCTKRLIEMAWQDRTPFEAIQIEFGLNENQVKKQMKSFLKPSSFKRWRKRVQGRMTKHRAKSEVKITRFQGPW